MKIWKKLSPFLPHLLLVAVFALIRFMTFEYSSLAFPFNILARPFLALAFAFPTLYEVLFWGGGAVLAMVIGPKPEKRPFLHRFVVRPILALAGITIVFGGMVFMQECVYHLRWNAKIAYVEDRIEEADEIIYYNLYSQSKASNEFTRPEIVHTCGSSHDMILIDYDSYTVSFLRDITHGAYIDFDEFQLTDGPLPNGYRLLQLDVELPNRGARLITYSPSEENAHRTIAMELILEDGTIYSIGELLEESSGFPYFLGLDAGEFDEDQITCS